MSDAGRPLAELRESGLLWLLNASVFHPRGLGLALHFDDDGAVTGWSLMSAGTDEPFSFPDTPDIHALFRAAERTLAEARS